MQPLNHRNQRDRVAPYPCHEGTGKREGQELEKESRTRGPPHGSVPGYDRLAQGFVSSFGWESHDRPPPYRWGPGHPEVPDWGATDAPRQERRRGYDDGGSFLAKAS